jgi:hypothetical protein
VREQALVLEQAKALVQALEQVKALVLEPVKASAAHPEY